MNQAVVDSRPGHGRVAAILLHWKDEETTRTCLDHLARVTYPELDVVVVDNGTTDDSAARLRQQFPWIRLVFPIRNLGHAGGLNAGAASVTSDNVRFFLFLDNDAFVEPEALTILMAAAAEKPDVGVLSPLVLSGKEPGTIWCAGGERTVFGNIRHFYMGRKADSVKLEPRLVSFATGCAMLVKRSAFEATGGFDEKLITYSDDSDFSVRILEAGYRILFVPGARIVHGESLNVIKVVGKEFRDYYTMRNRLFFIARHGNAFQRVAGIPVSIAWYGVLYGIVFLVTGRFARAKALLRGMTDFLVGRNGWRDL
jgi:GT2 family glycosyltransferase